MAQRIGQVIAKFNDVAGRSARSKFNVKITEVVSGILDMNAIAGDATSVIQKEEAISKCKFVSADIALPLDLSGGSFKGSAVSNSSVRRQAYVEFLSEPGDAKKPTFTRLFIPAPKDSVLLPTQTKVDKSASAVSDFINQVKSTVLTQDGRSLVTDGDTGVRRTVTRK